MTHTASEGEDGVVWSRAIDGGALHAYVARADQPDRRFHKPAGMCGYAPWIMTDPVHVSDGRKCGRCVIVLRRSWREK